MSLQLGLLELEKDLLSVFNTPKEGNTAKIQAQKLADAIYKYVKTGMPMTTIVTIPGVVAAATTQGNVTGSGIGGFDAPVPKGGLSQSSLESSFVSLWDSPKEGFTAQVQAKKIANAIHSYFSQAIIKTKDETSGPLPAPPPVGPVSGAISGNGGIDTDTPGKGYDSVKDDLINSLTDFWNDQKSDNPKTTKERANKIAGAIHSFCKEGKVSTSGTITAPAVVDPTSTSGSYLAGAGTSSSGSVS